MKIKNTFILLLTAFSLIACGSGQHELLTVCCFDMSEAVWCFRTEHMFLVR